MTIQIASRTDKTRIVDLFRKVVQEFIFTGVGPDARYAILQHLALMDRQPGTLKVNCRFETVPELRMTRIVIEGSFAEIPPMKD